MAVKVSRKDAEDKIGDNVAIMSKEELNTQSHSVRSGQTVVIVDRGFAGTPAAVAILERAGLNVIVSPATDDDEVRAAVRDADGIIDNGPLSRELIESLTRCKVIARSSIGMDTVDSRDIATAKGIVLCNMPGIIEEEVADQTMALLLCVARRMLTLDRYVREGDWARGVSTGEVHIPRLVGSKLGLVGLGGIGQALARRAAGFGFQIAAHDPFLPSGMFTEFGAKQVTLGEIFQDSDFVSLHVPLTPQTHHLVGERELKLMHRSAILINTSRGPVVDEQALVSALEEGLIAGAGLDVMEEEPIDADHPLCRLPNVVLAPHCASRSKWTDEERHVRPAQEVAAVLAGLRPRAVWNPEVLQRVNLR